MGSMKKVGNWNAALALASGLKDNLSKATNKSAAMFGLIAERIAKDHIANQDLGWEPLSEAYLDRKIAEGHSEFTLVRTSTYMQSITSWHEDFLPKSLIGYAGVKRGVFEKSEDGEQVEVANLAKIHEYGTDNIPARPLWGPTLKEALEEWSRSWTPIHTFQKQIEKGL